MRLTIAEALDGQFILALLELWLSRGWTAIELHQIRSELEHTPTAGTEGAPAPAPPRAPRQRRTRRSSSGVGAGIPRAASVGSWGELVAKQHKLETIALVRLFDRLGGSRTPEALSAELAEGGIILSGSQVSRTLGALHRRAHEQGIAAPYHRDRRRALYHWDEGAPGATETT